MENREKRNERLGMVISIGVHVAVMLLFLFILAWKAPDPPLPEYGIELNFGLDNVGSGNVQPVQPVSETENIEDAAPEETPDETVDEMEETEPVEEVMETVEETTENITESPNVVAPKEVVKEKTILEKKEEVKPEQKKPVEQKPENPSDGARGNQGTTPNPQDTNQGDNTNKEGDKGDEQGSLDARALYGNSGGGGGSSLQMTGWTWDFKPQPKDNSNESGRIVYEIKIDDEGTILSIKTLERSVSPAIEQIYKAEVQKLTFSKTSDNSIVAPVSTGRITFVIKSK